jgi:hypothetical protein
MVARITKDTNNIAKLFSLALYRSSIRFLYSYGPTVLLKLWSRACHLSAKFATNSVWVPECKIVEFNILSGDASSQFVDWPTNWETSKDPPLEAVMQGILFAVYYRILSRLFTGVHSKASVKDIVSFSA